MKKILAILILTIFFLYQTGNYFLFTIVRYMEKEKMEAELLRNIQESECEIINPANNTVDFYWEKENEIFYLNGVMYDVSKKKLIDGTVYLYCITETKEMELLDDLSLKISNASEGNPTYQLIESDEYILSDNSGVCPFTSPQTSTYLNYIMAMSELSKNIILPPPRPSC